MSMQSLNMRGSMIILAVLIAAYSVPTLSVAVPQPLNIPAKVPSGLKESVTVPQGLISSLRVLRDVKAPTIVLQKPSTAVNVPPKTAKSVAEPQGHQHASVRVVRETKARVTDPNTPVKVPTGTNQTSSITRGPSGRVLRETKASVAALHEASKLVKVPLSKADTVIHESNIPVRKARGTNESIIVLLETNKTTTQGNKTSVRVLRDAKASTLSDKPNIPVKESHGPVIPIHIDRDGNDSVAVRRETNKTFTVPQGNQGISVRVLRGTEERVSVPNKPNRPVKVSHGPNTPIRIPRGTNQSATEKPTTPVRKVRDINKSITNVRGSANVTTTAPKTTPPKLGNMITVPDNCPEGKKYVNGECREIWEPSR